MMSMPKNLTKSRRSAKDHRGERHEKDGQLSVRRRLEEERSARTRSHLRRKEDSSFDRGVKRPVDIPRFDVLTLVKRYMYANVSLAG